VNVNFVTARRLYDPLVVVLLHVHPVHQVRLTTSDHTNSCSACEWVRLPLLSRLNSIIPSLKVLLHGKAECGDLVYETTVPASFKANA